MAGMGPAPKADNQRRRRNINPVAMTRLPAEGRAGDPPPWPLPPLTVHLEDLRLAQAAEMEIAERELDVWKGLWALPQAVAWERHKSARVVARYVRYVVMAEGGNEKVAPEVRQLEDRLGLTPMAMLRLRWEIAADEVAEQRVSRPPTKAATQRAAARRLLVVDPTPPAKKARGK